MSKSRRQVLMLGVLIAALAGAVIVQRNGSTPASAPSRAQAARTPGTPGSSVAVSGLHLDRLTAQSSELAPANRNPFRFRERPAPAPPVARVVERPAPVLPSAPTGPPPPPPIPLKFIGLLDAPDQVGRLAILSDSRGGVFYGKEGDTIEGRYRVVRISNESADLAYVDGRGRQTIRLSGQ